MAGKIPYNIVILVIRESFVSSFNSRLMNTVHNPLKQAVRSRNHMIYRLERNNREILSLKDSLRSYICEPKTYSLFERFEHLKFRLEKLSRTNSDIIQNLREQKVAMEEEMGRVKQQLMDFQEVERRVLEYIGMAKMHS